MRAWYLMMGGLVCLALAPPVRAEVIFELDQQINDPPLSNWFVPPGSGLTAIFSENGSQSVLLRMQTHLNDAGLPGPQDSLEYLSELTLAVPSESWQGLAIFQLETTDPPLPFTVDDPTVASIEIDPQAMALQGQSGGSPQGTGYDIRFVWPVSNKGGNNPDRYSALYNASWVNFEITWDDMTAFTPADFLAALPTQHNDPANVLGKYVMAAHIQGIEGGRSAFIGVLDPPASAPEPGTCVLTGLGLVGLCVSRLRGSRRR